MNNMSEYESDALCQVPIMLLSEDVEINLVDSGFMPFSSNYTIIPYAKMNERQLKSLGAAYDQGSMRNGLLVNSMLRQGLHVRLTSNRFREDAVRVLVATHIIVCGGVRERASAESSSSEFSHVSSVIKARIVDSVLLPFNVLEDAQAKIAAFAKT